MGVLVDGSNLNLGFGHIQQLDVAGSLWSSRIRSTFFNITKDWNE